MKTARKKRAGKSAVRKSQLKASKGGKSIKPVAPTGADYTIDHYEDGEIVAITRRSDAQHFVLGDFVTNGTRMRGKILRFDNTPADNEPHDGTYKDLYVYTDWSDIGMNLGSIYRPNNNRPSIDRRQEAEYAPGDFCGMKLGRTDVIGAQVTKVAFTQSKVLYDLEIGTGDGGVTRIHSLDSTYIVPLDKKA